MLRIPVTFEQADELHKQGYITEANGKDISVVVAPNQEATVREAISALGGEAVKNEGTTSKVETTTEAPKQPSYPTDKSGEPVYMQMPIEQTNQVIDEFAGEDADTFIQNKITKAQKRLDKANKAKPKSDKLVEIKAEREAINVEKQAAQAEFDYWTQVQQARTKLGISNEELEINESTEQPNDANNLNDSTAPTEGDAEVEQEPQPIGVGAFGNIYNQFKGKAKEAFEFLFRNKSGDILGVFNRKGIGDIDVVWGNADMGLAHISEKHIGEGKSFSDTGDAITKIADVINNGEIEFENGDKIVIKKDGNLVTLRKNVREKGKKIADKNWILTAYNENAGDNTSAISGVNQGQAAPTPDISDSKDNTNSSTTNNTEEITAEEALDIYLKEMNEVGERNKQRDIPIPRHLENAIEKQDAEAETKWKERWEKLLSQFIGRDIPLIDGTIDNLKNTKGKDKESARYKAFDYIIKSLQKRKRELSKTLTEEDKKVIEIVKNKGILPQDKVSFRLFDQEQPTTEQQGGEPYTFSESFMRGLKAEAARRRKELNKVAKEFRAELKNNPDIVMVQSVDDLPSEAISTMTKKELQLAIPSKGWFAGKDGKAYILLENAKDSEDLYATLFHEAVSHKGLRDLLGKTNFAKLCQAVYKAMPEIDRERIRLREERERKAKVSDALIGDEYMAEIAEKISKTKGKTTIAEDIIFAIRNFFRKLKIGKKRFNLKLNENDIKHLLHASYNQLRGDKVKDIMNTALGEKIKQTAITQRIDEGIRHRLSNDAQIKEHTRFRMSGTPEEFETIQRQAVEEKGIIMPNLNNMRVNIVDVPRHDFKGTLKEARGEAKQWAVDNYVGKEFELPEDGGKYVISKKAIDKYLDETAIKKSDNASIHLSALKGLPQIISESIDVEIHPDYKKGDDGIRKIENGIGNKGLLVHRIYGAIKIGDNTYRVKTTMHEFLNKDYPTTPHSYEVTEIELIESSTTDASSSPSNVSTNSIATAKLLNGVEKSYDKGVKILDASKNNNSDIRFRFIGEQGAMNLDKAEERRNSLASETEDVAREDQIFIYDGLESANEGVRFSLGGNKTAPETESVLKEHQPSVVSSADGAKVIKDLDNAIKVYDENNIKRTNTFIGDLAKALNATRDGSQSEYATFEAVNGKVFTIRLSNHNATVSNFDNRDEKRGISIVITAQENKGVTNDGDAHITEFFYDAIKLRKADGKPLVKILESVKQSLYSGEYKDTTGLANVTDVNNPNGVNFRLSEETDNLLTSMEQRNREAYNSVMNIELPEAVTPMEIARNKKAEQTLFRFDKDFASMQALQEAMRQTELYKYNQSGRLSEAYKGLYDSMSGLFNLVESIQKKRVTKNVF